MNKTVKIIVLLGVIFNLTGLSTYAIDWESESFYRYESKVEEESTQTQNGQLIAKIEYGIFKEPEGKRHKKNVIKRLSIWGTNDLIKNKIILEQKIKELYNTPLVREKITLQRYDIEGNAEAVEAIVGTEYSEFGGPISPNNKLTKMTEETVIDLSKFNVRSFYNYVSASENYVSGEGPTGMGVSYSIEHGRIVYGRPLPYGGYNLEFKDIEETRFKEGSDYESLNDEHPFVLREEVLSTIIGIYFSGASEILAVSYIDENGDYGQWIPIGNTEFSYYAGPISQHNKTNSAKYSSVHSSFFDPDYSDYVARLDDYGMTEITVEEKGLDTLLTTTDFVVEMVKIADRIGISERVTTADFSTFTNTHSRYAIEAHKLGLINPGFFDSEKLITREEYVVGLVKILEMDAAPMKTENLDDVYFKDAEQISDSALHYMRIAYINRLLDTGFNKTVSPKSIMTREMSLKMRLNLLDSETFLVLDTYLRKDNMEITMPSDEAKEAINKMQAMDIVDYKLFRNYDSGLWRADFAGLLLNLYSEQGGKNIPVVTDKEYELYHDT